MATYYVRTSGGNDSNPGSNASPWKTINKAIASVNNGDTVRIGPGKYSEGMSLDTPAKHSNTTWMADDPNDRPRIDGGWHIGLSTGTGINMRMPAPPGSGTGARVGIKEGVVNVTLDGLIVQNCPGDGIACNGHNATVKNCVVYFVHRNGLMTNPAGAGRVDGLTVKNCKIIKTSARYLVDRDQGSACVILRELHPPVLFQDCELAYGHGEGIDIDKPSTGTETQPLVFERLLVHDFNHTTLYFNQTRHIVWRDSACFYSDTGAEIHGGAKQKMGYTVRTKDEDIDHPTTAFVWIYNNLFVNGGGLFIVGGGTAENATRNTQTRCFYVGNNTFVGGTWTKGQQAMKIASVEPRRNEGLFENNIIDLTYAASPQPGSITGPNNFFVRNNLWSHQPANSWKGTNHIAAAPQLVNAGAKIITTNYFTAAMDSWEKVTTSHNFNPNNYKLKSTSPARNAGSTGGAVSTNPPTTVPARVRQVDRIGTSRGAVPDIGAFEFTSDDTPPPDPPFIAAAFTRTPTTGNAPLTVAYNSGSSTVSGGAAITSYEWEFGDGTTSTAANPSKTYNTAGTYTTTLTIYDSVNGLSSSVTGGEVVVTAVASGSVTASFTRSPSAAETGDTITFVDTSTATGNGVINSWSWDFRDGSTSTLQNPTHVYTTAGAYRPRLTVQDTVRGYSHTFTGPTTTITDAPPEPSVEAGFTQSVSAGVAPLAVTFTDTSLAAGGATIDSWSWNFGDGSSSTTQSPTHTYTIAGSYRATLTVQDTANGAIDTHQGTTITVQAEGPPSAGGDVVIRQVRMALNTSDGNQTFTQAGLGGLTPRRARFIVTAATSDGTAADGEMLGIGATDGISQWAAAVAAEHNAATTNAARLWRDDCCLLLVDSSGSEILRATFVGWTADGVTINLDWTGAPAAYLLTVEFGAGSEYRAWVGAVDVGAVGTNASQTIGFAADTVRAVATWGASGTAANDLALSLGMAHRSGTAYVLDRYYADGLADADNRTRLFEGYIAHCRYNTRERASVKMQAWGATDFELKVMDDDINSSVLILAEKFGGVGSRVALVSAATSTGNTNYALDWDPQYVEHILSPRAGEGSSNDNPLSGTIGIHTVTADGEFSNLVSGENGSATTNEQSLSDNQLIVVSHAGVTLVAGATTLGTAEYSINYGTASGSALKWPSLAVEEGQATGGGGDFITAEFTATVTTGNTPLVVKFTDLSSSTNSIVSWLWDFGDGNTSTVQHPTHTYLTDDLFTVSLTVSDGSISSTIQKSDFVSPVTRVARKVIIGPYLLRPLSESSTVATHRDPDDTENAGYMEGETAFDALRIVEDPVTPAAAAGEWLIYADPNTGDLKVLRPDDTTGTVDVT